MKKIGKSEPSRLSPAAQVVQNLRTFEERTGRKLTPNQRWVLECCERQAGMVPDKFEDELTNEQRIADLKESLARKVAAYTDEHKVSLATDPRFAAVVARSA